VALSAWTTCIVFPKVAQYRSCQGVTDHSSAYTRSEELQRDIACKLGGSNVVLLKARRAVISAGKSADSSLARTIVGN